ncbi:hypothetical protein [Acidovorax sp. NCPPB 3576]|uniref:hypothetical protein n=1 Tax=Acidovorax sp. NCPPB 3576 TaxID=2940488 RepID=UPI00234A7BB3|nr:hypothetical protein [Acidovorax sp. NCPPB 3576]WCM88425.1 hypothetical protein M5C98_24350 [Acidovorax sp. NCPPB 3576]
MEWWTGKAGRAAAGCAARTDAARHASAWRHLGINGQADDFNMCTDLFSFKRNAAAPPPWHWRGACLDTAPGVRCGAQPNAEPAVRPTPFHFETLVYALAFRAATGPRVPW